ncbi:hypothetical protein QR97_01735 [Streptomyces sp. PBH53]|uniref:hypothetical protein n=1 Tax=Streptomyces sp. PBH53 TaxID=1577075 RepID=UPI000655F3F4|nr:hypothetical protein [Streptomyces sp. PBH53]AKN68693.1 hypothetical protein QR97_01735 [Streptomyces sp. PBH53]
MQQSDVNAALAYVRASVAAYKKNADQTRAAGEVGDVQSLGWHIDRMGERDDLAFELVEAWQVLDDALTGSHGIARPDAWKVPPLTDEQFAAALQQWPELAIFGEDLVRELSLHHGIRYVRWLAQRALKHARALAAAEGQPEPDACTCVTNCAEDPKSACSLSGLRHVHPRTRTGQYGPCPEHPDAPGDL